MSIERIIEDFKLFDNWLDKYQYIIELGELLAPYPEEFKTDKYKVTGCQSQVWFHGSFIKNKLNLTATSDAAIVKGLIYILLEVYNYKTPEEIAKISLNFIQELGLDAHLSSTRKNGLYSMIDYINKLSR